MILPAHIDLVAPALVAEVDEEAHAAVRILEDLKIHFVGFQQRECTIKQNLSLGQTFLNRESMRMHANFLIRAYSRAFEKSLAIGDFTLYSCACRDTKQPMKQKFKNQPSQR